MANEQTKRRYFFVQTVLKGSDGNLKLYDEKRFNKLEEAKLYRIHLINNFDRDWETV